MDVVLTSAPFFFVDYWTSLLDLAGITISLTSLFLLLLDLDVAAPSPHPQMFSPKSPLRHHHRQP
jgi:hypothetical protein